jgi:hypothetical protein
MQLSSSYHDDVGSRATRREPFQGYGGTVPAGDGETTDAPGGEKTHVKPIG